MMEFRTYTISPGSVEVLEFAAATRVRVLMTDAADVLWLAGSAGALDVENAVRLDKTQCPLDLGQVQSIHLHSPAQGSRTIQVSVLIGGTA